MNKYLITPIFLFCSFLSFAQISPTNLKCEYLTNPEGIDMASPRFYWQLTAHENGQEQIAYQLLVATSKEKLEQNIGNAFDSKKVKTNQNTHIVYKGDKLIAATQYFWKVKVWDAHKNSSKWSEIATFSTGLFNDEDWKGATWMAWKTQEAWETAWWERKEVEQQCHELTLPAYFGARMSMWERYYFHNESPYDPSPLYRKEFSAKKEIQSAKAFISGIGYHELFINGEKVDNHVLDPGWTNYTKTILYVSHDVTDYLQKGDNAIGVMLGRGNYGLLANDHWGFWKKGGYVGQPKLKCRVRVVYKDGSEEDIISDMSWKVTGGPIVYDDPHMGEIYDATKEVPGWNKTGLDDSDWDKVNSAQSPGGALKSQLCEPIRVVKKSKPIKLETQGWRKNVWGDAGVNMAGWIRIKINAPKGTRISIYYGEKEIVMDLYQPGGLQQMAYIAKGVPGEIAECHFSYKGFRYFLIKGHPKPLTKNDIEVCQVNSDVEQVGRFECSDETINAIHKITDHSMISNLHSIPTDCPHREKNGWMGDAVTGLEMGMSNYDLAAITTKYIRDIFDGQDPISGGLATIAPDNAYDKGRSPLWGSAGVYLPYYMYNYYGDTRIIEKYWNQMLFYTKSVWDLKEVKDKPGIFTDVLSDWSSPFGNQSDDGNEVYATMNFYKTLNILAAMGDQIGKTKDARTLKQQANTIREAIYTYCFDEKEIRFKGLAPTPYRQGPNALALQNGIVKPEHREKVLTDLIYNIKVSRDNHIYGGIFTGLALWELLPKEGYAELAFDVAVNDTYPGYGFMLKNGATSLWEHWEDKSSHNHYFKGYIDNYFYRFLAGINFDTKNPGFKKIILTPKFIPQLEYVKGSYKSIHGEIKAEWKKVSVGHFEYKITIPANCKAEVFLPSGKKVVASGTHKLNISIK